MREPSGFIEPPGPQGCRNILTTRECPIKPVIALTQMPMHLPKPGQCDTQAQGLLDLFLLQQPSQDLSQIAMLLLESLQPQDLLGTLQFRLCLFCERQIVGGVRLMY